MDAQLGAEAEPARAACRCRAPGVVVAVLTPSTGASSAAGATRARARTKTSSHRRRLRCRSSAGRSSRTRAADAGSAIACPRDAGGLDQRQERRAAGAAARTRAKRRRARLWHDDRGDPARDEAQVVVERGARRIVDAHGDRCRRRRARRHAARTVLRACGDGVLEVDDDRVGAARQRLRVALGRSPGTNRYERGDIAVLRRVGSRRERSCAARGFARSRARSRRGSRRRGRPRGARPCPRSRRATACCPGRP